MTNDIELGLVEASGGGEPVVLDAGSPLYFSWDPSGEELLTHVGMDRHPDDCRGRARLGSK